MFNKKSSQIKTEKKVNLDIETIPEIFYGGQNPIIYKENTPIDIKNNLGKVSKKQSKFSKKQKIIFFVILAILLTTAVSAFVVYDYLKENLKSNLANIAEAPKKIVEESAQGESDLVEEVKEAEVETSTEDSLEEIAEVVEEKEDYLFLNFPPIILANTADSDGDELTDFEEEVFSLDSGTWDTDNDGYYDGQEVNNLYNPKGYAPVKIIDSGLVSEYVNAYFNYRIYYPQIWEKGEVDKDLKQVIFSSITGDFISVTVFERQNNEDFYSWFAREANDQKASDLSTYINRFNYRALMRKDGLVYYFENDRYFFVLLYNPRDLGPIKYRSLFKMIAQSFRTSEFILEKENSLEVVQESETKNVDNNSSGDSLI